MFVTDASDDELTLGLDLHVRVAAGVASLSRPGTLSAKFELAVTYC
jgi:hypothetical protein